MVLYSSVAMTVGRFIAACWQTASEATKTTIINNPTSTKLLCRYGLGQSSVGNCSSFIISFAYFCRRWHTQYHIFFDNMLLPYLKALESKIVVLGSRSKSRNELMTAQGIKYKVIPSKFAEDLEHASYDHPKDYNMDTCRGKVQELRARFQAEGIDWDVLICGDTIVQHDGKIIEKPSDYDHCVQMVTALAGNTHRIYTAHTVLFNGKKHGEWVKEQWVTSAEVTFGEIPPQVIAEFAKQPQPYLHSGGYELTAMSGGFLKSIKGSHSAVQGLDMHEICWSLIRGGKRLNWF